MKVFGDCQRASVGPCWFGDWLRERTQGAVTSGDQPTWSEILDRFGNDGCGLLYVLLVVAAGQRTFEARISDLLCLVAMSPSRFDELVQQFCAASLIEVTAFGDVGWWTVLKTPSGWEPAIKSDDDGFYRPSERVKP